MAATLKTYDVICPACEWDFQVSRDPAELAKGDGELVECPNCFDEFEWDYDETADTLELTPYDDDKDTDDGMGLACEDDDDEDEDEY
jgi:hypothetical protein